MFSFISLLTMHDNIDAIVAVRMPLISSNEWGPKKIIQSWTGSQAWPQQYRWSSLLVELSGQLIARISWVTSRPMVISVTELQSSFTTPDMTVLSVSECHVFSYTRLCLNQLSPVHRSPFSVCSTCLDPHSIFLCRALLSYTRAPPPVKPCPNEHHIFSTTKQHMFCATISLQFDALGSSSVKPRSKRYVHRHTTKVSFKDLTLELAKKHVSLLLLLSSSQIEPTN